jgi:hypothetical protein
VIIDEREFLDLATKRLKREIDADEHNRQAAIEDLKFLNGDQWDPAEEQRRRLRGRPCLKTNELPKYVNQVVGDMRHNRARIKVRPVDPAGDVNIARIRSGLISNIEYLSNAEAIYDYAGEMATSCGLGAWRVLTRYTEENPFICEELLEGVEPGIDAITWEGELIFPTCCGYEEKGSGVIERVYRTQADLPDAAKWVDEGLAPEFDKAKTRFFYSAEFKIGPSRIPYLIDPTIRLAAPGVAAIQTELFENYTEVIYGLATGEKVSPVISHNYAAALALESSEAHEAWVNVGFPKEMRRWLKLRMAVRKGEDYYCVPGFESVGTVIGFGGTVREAVDLVKARAKQVKGKRLTMEEAGLDVLADEINKGKQYGINF